MLWYFLLYFVLLLFGVESKLNLLNINLYLLNIQNHSDSEYFECIKAVSVREINYHTVIIDTNNIKDEMKSITITEAIVKKIIQNQISVVISSKANNFSSKDLLKGKYKKYDNSLTITCFETCEDSFDLKDVNIETRNLIVISAPITEKCVKKLQKINYPIDTNDITFMFYHKYEDQCKFYTFIPTIDQDTCQQYIDKPVHINTYSKNSLHSRKIFPRKVLKNLKKCPLKIGMSTLYPFSNMENEASLQIFDEIDEPTGVDIKILKAIAKFYNATIDIYYLGSGRDIIRHAEFIKLMLNGSLDVCAGGLYRVYGNTVAYSDTYARQAIVWIYHVEREERSWMNLMRKLQGFFAFLTFYVFYSIIYYIICLFDGDTVSLTKIFLYAWGKLIGANFAHNPRSIKQNILNVGYLVISIHLCAYISIQMYSFLTIRQPPQLLNTNDEIMDSGKQSFLIKSLKFFVRDDKYNDFANRSGDCLNFTDCVGKVIKYDGLTIVLQADFYHFQSTTAVHSEASILRAAENILTVYNNMLIRKDSPIVNQFSRVLQTLVEAGITERLYEEEIGLLAIAKAANANSNMIKNSYNCKAGCSITVKQFAGIFYFWMLGCMLSFIIFSIELYMNLSKM